MRKQTAWFVCLFLAVVVATGLVPGQLSVVRAQENQVVDPTIDAASPQPVAPNQGEEQSTIVDKPDYQTDIKQLTDSYRGQLAEYLTLQREFEVAKGQYQQLKTLAALEKAVIATKAVMLKRQQVLETYLRLLRVQLLDAEGIELSTKQAAIDELSNHLTALGVHKQTIETMNDRLSVAAVAKEFTTIGPGIEQSSYYTLSLLNLGALQQVADKAKTLTEDIQDQVTQGSEPIQQAQQQRAVAEINRTMDKAQTQLTKLRGQISANRVSGSRSNYTQLLRDMQPIYADLSQVLAFQDELLRGK